MSLYKNSLIGLAALIMSATLSNAYAADDPSIKGDLRENIKQSMASFIQQQTIDGEMYVYDAVDGQLLSLTLDELHSGIVKKGDFYVSCADFKDEKGRKIDVDFMVRQSAGQWVTTQALIHSVAGHKRKYHLEK